MEKSLALRQSISSGDYAKALSIVDEMEAMSKEDKLEKIDSYAVILLLHLIKQEAEARTTKSWTISIKNYREKINRIDKRRKSGSYCAQKVELAEIIDDAMPSAPALRTASLEAFEGSLNEQEISDKINIEAIKGRALKMLDW